VKRGANDRQVIWVVCRSPSSTTCRRNDEGILCQTTIISIHRNDYRILSKRCRGGQEKGDSRIWTMAVPGEAARAQPRPPRRVAVTPRAAAVCAPGVPRTCQSPGTVGMSVRAHTPAQAWIKSVGYWRANRSAGASNF
jgi:hypothetical protein